MKTTAIKQRMLTKQQAKQKFANIILKTRQRTSTMVKFWKQIGQLLWERIPVVAPLQELISGKGFISDVSIIKYSPSRRGRIIIVCTEGVFAYIVIVHGTHILREVKRNLSNIIFHGHFPQHISIQTAILMIVMCIGTIGYYGMIKPGDFKQAVKEHKEERETY